MSCSAGGHNNLGILQKGQWQLSGTYQYYKSFRHFRGDVEETERLEHGTEVINRSHSLDIALSHAITDRFAVTLNIPYLHFDRSSLYEHYGNSEVRNPDQTRFSTSSSGLGDIRLTANYWILDPGRDSLNGNISFGLGLKFPSGNYAVTDQFHKLDSEGNDSTFTRPVDQSIQLGDGGWGFSTEVQGFWRVFKRGWFYFNGFYLFNPQEVNSTLRSGEFRDRPVQNDYFSVPDQYSGRIGINYGVLPKQGISISLGGRLEGIPAHDALGGSEGYRRPGYIVSIEPGISYMHKQLNFNLLVPVAVYRNRIKSVWDLSDPTGQRHGDAAFADYLISFSAIYRFGGRFEEGQIPILNR